VAKIIVLEEFLTFQSFVFWGKLAHSWKLRPEQKNWFSADCKFI